MEPRRLLDEGATEIEKALLAAGREDGPRAAAAGAVLAAIHAAPLPLPHTGSGAALGAAAGKAVVLATWAKIGLLAAGLGGAALVTHHYTRARTPAEAPARVVDAVPAAPGVSVPATGDDVRRPETTVAAPAAGAREGRPRPARPPREPPRAPSASSIDHSLGLETRALDRAREALDGHRFAEALRLIGEYDATFPHGRLRPEAMVLRLAGLVHSGRHPAARSLADRLLADEAYKPYEARIRSLLRETER